MYMFAHDVNMPDRHYDTT